MLSENQRKEALKELEELQARAEALEKMLKQKPWKPSGGGWFVGSDGVVYHLHSTKHSRICGNEYKTKEEAKVASYRISYGNPAFAYFKDRETAEKAIEIIDTWDWVEL